MTAPSVVAVVGATATGKSELGVQLAEAIGGEVVNADALQLYRGMDIGTAKLPVADRLGVPHHVLDVLDVWETATVADYAGRARAAIADCHHRAVVPVLVGGSPLYVRAVLDGLDFPGTEPGLRRRLEDEVAENGSPALHARLARVDPRAAARILPTNARRVVRALEVVELTGRPFRAALPDQADAYPGAVVLGLRAPRDALDARIATRVERMWRLGLVDEVRALEALGLREGRTASRALGYAQVLSVLAGIVPEEVARADTVSATRRFARRQESWFGKDPRVRWLAHDARDLLRQARALVS